MKKIILGIIGFSCIGLVQAGESVVNPKTTATMQATCSIEVNPVGFGVVATPLMSQSANSEMNVKCSNASAYTIDLAYGGIYGQGSSNSGYTLTFTFSPGYDNRYDISNSSGVYQGYLSCGYGGWGGQSFFSTIAVAQLYGSNTVSGWHSNTISNACQGQGNTVDAYPTGWVGAYNKGGGQPLVSKLGYSYGVMQGSFKGDKLAYSIAVPGEPTKVWNAGNNSYKSTGNGEFQVIPVVAKIVPDKSGSQYPAPDMYLDTITAVISY